MSPSAERPARGTGPADFLISLSGASPRILRRCPTERPKYTGIGSAILVTALISGISMAFALRLDAQVPLVWAVLLGMALGVTIMALDRWLIAALDRQSNPWRYLILAAPRIALGVILGVVITTPLLLQIFVSYINGQLAAIHSSQLSTYYAQLPSTALSHRIAIDDSTVANLQKVIDSGGATALNPFSDPEVESLNAQLASANKLAASSYKLWSCQLYGGPSCSTATGNGPLAAADHTAYLNATEQVNNLTSEIQSREAFLQAQNVSAERNRLAQAQTALPAAESRSRVDTQEQLEITAAFQQSVSNNNGLLPRLQALSQVTKGASTINAVRWLLYALFVLIQCLPISVKVLLNLGPENTYEKMLALQNEQLLRAARDDVARRQAIRNLD
jgi:hypothetical protein